MKVKIAREFDVVLPCDESLPPEEQTVWHCRRLDYREETRMSSVAERVGQAEAGRLAIKAGLTGVTNLFDDDGHEVPFKTAVESPLGMKRTAPHDEFLNLLDVDTRLDLANRIIDANTITEDDAKN
ncbi:MAG: hypothetical protein ACPGVY_14515 [Mycobacterium sp.]